MSLRHHVIGLAYALSIDAVAVLGSLALSQRIHWPAVVCVVAGLVLATASHRTMALLSRRALRRHLPGMEKPRNGGPRFVPGDRVLIDGQIARVVITWEAARTAYFAFPLAPPVGTGDDLDYAHHVAILNGPERGNLHLAYENALEPIALVGVDDEDEAA